MNFSYNENQKMIVDMVQQFGKQYIEPYAREWDDNQIFPVEVFKKLGELGLMGVLVPSEYGGSGFSYTEYITAIEQLSIFDPSIGLSMAAHNSLYQDILHSLMRIRKKSGYKAAGEWIGGRAQLEHNTGSDVEE